MKKAFLVDVSLRTRVEVDVPDDFDLANTTEQDEATLDAIGLAACERLTDFVLSGDGNPICLDNVVEIEEDYEMPYDEDYTDDTDDSDEIVHMKDAFRKKIVSLLLNGTQQNETRKEYYVNDIKTKLCIKEYTIVGENDILVDIHSIVIENTNNNYNVVLRYKVYDMLFDVDISDVNGVSLYNLVKELQSKTGL